MITYDLRGENEELFGLGIGCDGLLRILLQRLSPAGGYEPFARMADILRGDAPAHCAVVLADQGDFRTGDTLFSAGADFADQRPAGVGRAAHARSGPCPACWCSAPGPTPRPS